MPKGKTFSSQNQRVTLTWLPRGRLFAESTVLPHIEFFLLPGFLFSIVESVLRVVKTWFFVLCMPLCLKITLNTYIMVIWCLENFLQPFEVEKHPQKQVVAHRNRVGNSALKLGIEPKNTSFGCLWGYKMRFTHRMAMGSDPNTVIRKRTPPEGGSAVLSAYYLSKKHFFLQIT